MAVSTYLLHLEKVYKKIYSKEYCLVEQSLYKLKTKEAVVAKTGSNPTVVETAYTSVIKSLSLIVYLLPLADLFFFYFSFF